MNHILFGQSYYLRFDPKLLEAMQPYPPLGTLYAAAHLRAAGYSVALFDAMLAGSEEEWAAALEREKPDIAVIYEDNFNYLSKMCLLRMREAAYRMAGMARARGIPVIAAGSDASDHAAAYIEAGCDYVLIGEGEATLLEVLEVLTGAAPTELADVKGLAWTDPKGEIRINPRRPDLKDLDAIPFPAWDLVDVERYREIWQERHGYFSMNMVTTRGCPYHCNWCAKPIWGQRYNSRSPENVAAEMKWLHEHFRPDHIWFADDIIGLKPGWLANFAEALEKKEVKIPFKCLSRVDLLLREGDISALARAGAEIVWVGAESGSQKILTAMEKGTRVEQIHAAANALRNAGIKVGFFLQFGYPGETWADIEATLKMVREIMPDDIGMSVSYPLPGTSFFDRVRDHLGEKANWTDSSDLAMLYEGPFSTAFYRQLHITLHKDYRARKNQRALFQGQFHARALAALVHQRLTLPLARRKLHRLAGAPRPVRFSGDSMPLEESSRPTPQ